MSQAKEMSFWELNEENPPQSHFRIIYTRDIVIMKSFENYIAFGCKSGQFSLFEMKINGN
jgi:hypothetical protein